jgi:hypothetical protein
MNINQIIKRADAPSQWAKNRENGVFFTLTLPDERHCCGFVKKQAVLSEVIAALTSLIRMEAPEVIRSSFPKWDFPQLGQKSQRVFDTRDRRDEPSNVSTVVLEIPGNF